MLLVVGLGNPGPQHAGNRHNIGFMAVDAIVRRHRFSPWRRRFQGAACEGEIAGAASVLPEVEEGAAEAVAEGAEGAEGEAKAEGAEGEVKAEGDAKAKPEGDAKAKGDAGGKGKGKG